MTDCITSYALQGALKATDASEATTPAPTVQHAPEAADRRLVAMQLAASLFRGAITVDPHELTQLATTIDKFLKG